MILSPSYIFIVVVCKLNCAVLNLNPHLSVSISISISNSISVIYISLYHSPFSSYYSLLYVNVILSSQNLGLHHCGFCLIDKLRSAALVFIPISVLVSNWNRLKICTCWCFEASDFVDLIDFVEISFGGKDESLVLYCSGVD